MVAGTGGNPVISASRCSGCYCGGLRKALRALPPGRPREGTGESGMGGKPAGGARFPARAAGRDFPVANGEAALPSRPSSSANENLLQCCGGRRRGGGVEPRAGGCGRGAADAERGGTEAERLAGHGAAPGCRTAAGALRGPVGGRRAPRAGAAG